MDTAKKDYKVVYAASTSLAMAKKALLKNRLDIALPEAAFEDSPEATILFTVARRGPTFEARLFSVPAPTTSNPPRELLCLTLPGSAPAEDDATGSSVFSVHFATGTLNFLSAENLTTYTLTTTTPTLTSSLHLTSPTTENPTPSSLLRIAPSTVLVATNEHVSLYDTKFSSLQARVPIQSSSTAASTPAQSRSSTPAGRVQGGVFLTAYLPELDLAIGYSQNGIVAVQISRGGSKESRKKSGLLIDSLCRGVDGLEMPAANNRREREAGPAMKKVLSKIASEKAKLANVITKLREARRGADLERFEAAFADYVGVKRNVLAPPAEDTTMANTPPSEASLESNPLPEFISNNPLKTLSNEFVTTVLSLIFEPTTTTDGTPTLTITFYPPNVIKHLADSGNLSTTLLPPHTASTLVSTLTTYDPSLRTLGWALSSVSALPTPEVVSAIAAALHPSTDEDLALKVIRSEVLRLALIRLDAFPAVSIIAALKAGLSGEELMALITLLRKELSVRDEDEGEVGVGIGDLGIVAELLGSALDCVGVGALVVVDGGVVEGLFEEVGEAVEVGEEAAGLKGILEEMFRHADWRRGAIKRREGENTRKEVEDKTEKRKGRKEKKKRLEVLEKKSETETVPKETAAAEPVEPVEETALALAPSTAATRRRTDTKTPRKARLSRADPTARAAHVARLQARRKPRVPQGRHGKKVVSALLPLGLAPPPPSGLVMRGLVGSGMGAEVEKREVERKKGREANLRDSLVAGVYSVESFVV